MIDFIKKKESLLIPRKSINLLISHFRLPLSILGKVFVETEENINQDDTSVDQWINSSSPLDQEIINWISFLANPLLLADIRIYYHQISQLRTWALTGKIEDDAPWLFIAPVNDGQDYKIHPLRGVMFSLTHSSLILSLDHPYGRRMFRFSVLSLSFLYWLL